jgi:hypothetical protein
MRNRAERVADRLADVRAFLKVYREPPLNEFVDSAEIAELIRIMEREEQLLICRLAELGGQQLSFQISQVHYTKRSAT